MNNCEIMGFKSRTRKRYQTLLKFGTLGLTRCLTSGKMLPNNKERHDCGSSQAIHYRPGMDPTREAKEERHALSVCGSQSWQQDRVEIHFISVKSGNSDRRQDTRKAGCYPIKKAWFPRQLNYSVATNLFPKVFQAQGKRFSIATGASLEVIIDGMPKYRQALVIQGNSIDALVASKECVLCMSLPLDFFIPFYLYVYFSCRE